MISYFEEFLRRHIDIYIYGAGKVGRCVYAYLKDRDISPKGFVVSGQEGNPSEIGECPVFLYTDLSNVTDAGLLIAVAGSPARIMERISDIPFQTVLYVNQDIRSEIDESQKYGRIEKQGMVINRDIRDVQPGFCLVNDPVTMEPFAEISDIDLGDFARMCKLCTKSELEDLFGRNDYVPRGSGGKIGTIPLSERGVELYTAIGQKELSFLPEIEQNGRIPLLVGTDFTTQIVECLCDNMGESISDRNRNYSECTGTYWIWKNTSGQSYVGQEHYRRRLFIDQIGLDYIFEKDIDAVMAMPLFSLRTVKEQFLAYIPADDWELLKRELCALDVAYEPLMKRYEDQGFLLPCNIALMKRQLFDEYCEFAFGIAEKIHIHYQNKGWIRNDRYMGYLFENMETLFFMRHKDKYKLAYSELHWIG